MTATFHALRSLLFAVAVLLTGHGLQLTLLPLEAQALGWSDSAIGLTGSFYYLGFIVGCLTIPRLIRRVGHIRTFTVCISVAAVALLAASISEVYVLWLGLRMATGWSMAGLYTTIESWLNDRAQNEQRGRVLAVSDTPKTEFFWYEAILRDEANRKDIASMLMMLRFMKASSKLWQP